jgi:ABC-type tungstate transport system substrate-binding protein
MTDFGAGLAAAWRLITTFDHGFYSIVGLSLAVSIAAVLLAALVGVPVGAVLTSLAFAFIHQSQLAHAWAPLLLLFLVGLALTIIRARTGSVAASFLAHVGYNGTLFALLYFGTDHFRHLERMS